MDDPQNTFAERLRVLRAAQKGKPSQDDLAKVAGIHQTSISRWESEGLRQANELVKLADHFGVSVDFLLGRCDQRSFLVDHGALEALWKATSMKDIEPYLDEHGELPFATRIPRQLRFVDELEHAKLQTRVDTKLRELFEAGGADGGGLEGKVPEAP